MTFTHRDIQQHLIEFLYGELDGEARAAFDAHVGACAQCQVEVTAFERTRATARAAVRAPLAEPVPAAVWARVMEAATRAAAERASTGRAPAVRASAPDGKATSRWLAWLRARWTLPMLTTVAAMGALLLFRETIFREARRPLGDRTVEDLLPKGASAPPRGQAPAVSAPTREGSSPSEIREPAPVSGLAGPVGGRVAAEKAAGSSERDADSGFRSERKNAPRERASKPASEARRRAPNPVASAGSTPARKAKADLFGSGKGGPGQSANKRGFDDQLLSKIGAGSAARPTAGKDEQTKSAKPGQGSLDDLLEGSLSRSKERPRSNDKEYSRAPAKSVPVAAEAQSESESDVEIDRGSARFAQPPPAAQKPAVAAAPPPAPAPRAPAPPAASARGSAESSAGPSKRADVYVPAAPTDAPSSAAPAKKSKKAESTAVPATPATAAHEPAVPAPTGSASRPPPDPAALLVERAEKLMVARRFSQAAAAYRDLLQRFPQHASLATWRRRLAIAQAAAAQEQNQPATDDSGFATPPPPR